MTRKRSVLTLWLLLLGVNFLLISQNWYSVSYRFDGTVKQLSVTGASAWNLINAAETLSLISFAAVFLSRGWLRIAISWITLILVGALTAVNISQLGVRIPPMVNSQIETASGVAGGGNMSTSAAIDSIQAATPLILASAVCMALLVLVQLLASVSAAAWTKTEAADRYAKQERTKVRAAAKVAAANSGTDFSGTDSSDTDSSDSKGRNISLWDSQR